jgi:hypothetical protein
VENYLYYVDQRRYDDCWATTIKTGLYFWRHVNLIIKFSCRQGLTVFNVDYSQMLVPIWCCKSIPNTVELNELKKALRVARNSMEAGRTTARQEIRSTVGTELNWTELKLKISVRASLLNEAGHLRGMQQNEESTIIFATLSVEKWRDIIGTDWYIPALLNGASNSLRQPHMNGHEWLVDLFIL